MRRQAFQALVIGLAGAAILLALGIWQMQRLAWKQAVLAAIETRIAATPVPLPAEPDPVADRYLPVEAEGMLGTRELHVLVSRKQIGAGFRIVTTLDSGGRVVMVDRGFVAEAMRDATRDAHPARIEGNLHWPDERRSATPPDDVAGNIWFARDVKAMAAALGAAPILIVARSPTGDGIEPLPVDTAAIPNDHLHYAVTWFSLAAVWLGMTGLWLWRIRRRTV